MKCPKCNEEMTTGVCLKCELESIRKENESHRKKASVLKILAVILIPAFIAVVFFLILPRLYFNFFISK